MMTVSRRVLLGTTLVLLVLAGTVLETQAKFKRQLPRQPRTLSSRSRRSGVPCKSVDDCQSGECCPKRLGRCLPLLTEARFCRPITIQRGIDCPCAVGLHCDVSDKMKLRPVIAQYGTCAVGEVHEDGVHEISAQVRVPRPGPVFRAGGGRRVPSKERVRHLIQKMSATTGRRTWG